MSYRNLDFIRGELVGASRALLAAYMRQAAPHTTEEADVIESVFGECALELQRLVNNEFQFFGNDLGDPVQFALTVLLMIGEEHSASGRHSKGKAHA